MAVLEKVMQMKDQGLTESQIIKLLRQEGVSPKDINDSLNQSRIKSNIGNNQDSPENTLSEMKPSIMLEKRPESATPNPETEENYPEYETANQQYESPQEGYYGPSQRYDYYPEYQAPQQSAMDIETVNEIVEQIVEEKNSEIKKQVNEFKKFREDSKLELEKFNERISRIENTFNELQVAILKKIGEYGDNIKNISEEMQATQDSFSKILNPLTNNIRELQKITGQTPSQQNSGEPENSEDNSRKKSVKSKTGFEEYLR